MHAATLCVSANNNRFDNAEKSVISLGSSRSGGAASPSEYFLSPLVDLRVSSDLIAECRRVEDKDIDD